MDTEVISVCLFVCPIITHEPLDQFASHSHEGTRENHGNVLSFEILSLVGKIVKKQEKY